MKQCPFAQQQYGEELGQAKCSPNCELWCDGEKCCSIKLIGMELIKLGEGR
jgi:hypothetical protein